MSAAFVGSDFGKETLRKEYKQVTLKSLFEKCDSGVCEKWFLGEYKFPSDFFNFEMLDIIKNYILKYIPKYLSCFSNAEINGKLYLGIHDSGIVYGIPYIGDLPDHVVMTYVYESLSHVKPKISMDNMHEFLDIKIIKLKYPNENQTDIKKYVDSYLELRENNNRKIKAFSDYRKSYMEWVKSVQYYSSKLINYAKDTNLNNIVKNYVNEKFNHEHPCRNESIQKLLYMIDNIEMVSTFDGNFKIKSNRESSIKGYPFGEYLKKSLILEDEMHPLKWLMECKDDYQQTVINNRPFQPKEYPTYDPVRYRLLDNKNINFRLRENGANFYLIKIKMIFNDVKFSYRKNNSYYNLYRCISRNNEPIAV